MGGTQSSSSMWLYLPDCDAAFERATDAGAKTTMPVTFIAQMKKTGR